MLHIHRAERADGLVDMLSDLVADPLGDAMAAEIVAVPTRGVERWLSQRLAGRLGATPGRGDGVCANIDFSPPSTLVGRVLAIASGVDPDGDPWRPERSVWPLLDVVDACLDQPWLRPLADHLHHAAPAGGARRLPTVRHFADLYDRYGLHRPEMIRAWAAGRDDGVTISTRWQAALWRGLRERIATPSPAERLVDACAALREATDLVDLPGRLSLFGLTRLPVSHLDVLGALGAVRDVHLFLLHPSPALWDRLVGLWDGRSGQPPPRRMRRGADPTAEQATNPLLASWGRDAREMQIVLAAGTDGWIDAHRASAPSGLTLLGRIQADVHADRAPPGDDARAHLDPDDRSIQVHACHGRARQVEVLRDAVLHLLEDDPDLEPRDVIVLCPDIETYAPLIHATFGVGDPSFDPEASVDGPHPDLRVRLADRSIRQTNPVLGAVAHLLGLASARITASQVLDFAGREPVRRRFGFDDDDLSRLEEWVVGAGIRWGIDADHRAPYKLAALGTNTWHSGLDRTLLGVAMADEDQRLFGGVLPLDDVGSGDIELVGRFAELVDRLGAAVDSLNAMMPIESWAATIADAADALVTASGRDAWQRAQLQRLLDDLVDEAAGSSARLGLGDIVSLLSDRLRGRPTRANFRTGHLTICTLVPMRSVPHRVVCLLGIDDGVFPRVGARDGDDLILADPHVGDRDARSEDRQLLLDALLAATDHLVITYAGRDDRTNTPRPPAVPVGELLDVIDRSVRTAGGAPARAQVVVNHPLQPFDPRNFITGHLVPGRPWSFDTVNLEGAEALRRDRETPDRFLPGPLPDLDRSVIELDDLERFLRHPVAAFLRLRLGIRSGDRSREVDDALPVELDALARWAIGERLLSASMAGADLDRCVAAERAGGLVPPGALASAVFNSVVPVVRVITAAASDGREPTSLDVNVALPDGTTVVGTVPGVRGDLLHRVSFSRLAANHRILTWVRLLALTASRPERPFEAVTIGRVRPKAPPLTDVTVARIGVLGDDTAARRRTASGHLEVIVDLFRRGMREPLPLYCKTSAAWAQARPLHRNRLASGQWTTPPKGFPLEDADPAHQRVLGGIVPFDRLLDEAPRADEDAWGSDEASRFGLYALRLWAGLLDHEQVSDQ